MISIIIPTFNRSNFINDTLNAISKINRKDIYFEVIIVIDGGELKHVEKVKTFTKFYDFDLSVILIENSGPSKARNVGASYAKYNWLLFTDDDCLPQENWLNAFVNWIKLNGCNSEIAGCGGKIIRYEDDFYSNYIDWQDCMNPPKHGSDNDTIYLVTANALYRKNIFMQVGGFNTEFKWPGGEDPELSFRITACGLKLKIIDDAVIKHRHRYGLKSLKKMYWHHGLGSSQIAKVQGQKYNISKLNIADYFRLIKTTWRRTRNYSFLPYLLLEIIRINSFYKGYNFISKIGNDFKSSN
jgi:glycosyltransferase involved in cell wall biosynthesis